METLLLSREEIARRAREWYDKHIRSQVETPENIGRMVVINIERIGYKVAATL
ncbi:hypothetical protein [Armatimonas sp.]|uniref:hypothetical protein n=1 Tax=Armatimonas sp. TaxID=1872638 RepID=UPI003751A227